MHISISETLKKINRELSGIPIISISISLIICSLFVIFKSYEFYKFSNSKKIKYSQYISNSSQDEIKLDNNYIYASKNGKKYYFYYCKSTIKEENKIYFENEQEAIDSGRTLSSQCKS